MTRRSWMDLCATRTLAVLAFAFFAVGAKGQTISGTVRPADGGSGLRSMVVAAYTTTGLLKVNTTTDATGHYDLTLAPGQYRVLAYDPQGTFATEFAGEAPSFEESPLIAVVSDQSVTVNFTLRRGVRITGTVATTGGLRGSLTVAAYNLSGTRRGFATPTSTGSYSLVLPPGSYKFGAYDDAGFLIPSFFHDQTSFADADVVVVDTGRTLPRVDFLLVLGARVTGIVTDTAGVPIANVSVLVYSTDGRLVSFVQTDADGHFAMTVGRGSYRFVAIDPSFVFAAGFPNAASSFTTSAIVTLSDGQFRSDLTFRLERGGLLEGSVVDAATGAGIAGITVAAYNVDGTMRTFVITDSAGHYALLLPPGPFRIGAFDTALVYATQFYPQRKAFDGSLAISATVGQSSTLQPFTLSRGGHVSGTVKDRNTTARIAGVIIQAYDASGVLAGSATSASDGTYRIALPPGSYRLIAADAQLLYAPGYDGGASSFDTAVPITVNLTTDAKADFDLTRGTLVIGSVVDDLNQPLGGIEVSALDSAQNRVATATTLADGSFRLALVPGTYRFMATDASGRYETSYAGGSTFATAGAITVDATGAPRITITVHASSRRRAVHH